MKKPIVLLLINVLFLTTCLNAQTITGNFPLLGRQAIQLRGFTGLQDYIINSAAIDSLGNFKLNYSKDDCGMGYLVSNDGKPYIVMLSGEDIVVTGETLSNTASTKIVKGQQNRWFAQYADDYAKREQALNAWNYLEKMYASDSFFRDQKSALKSIKAEEQRIKAEDEALLSALPKDNYLNWFIPIRKLVGSVSVVAKYRPEAIRVTREALRKIDYADPRLYKSGLFKDAIENHIWFIENSSGDMETVYADLNISIDAILQTVKSDQAKFNEVADFLFNLLEKRSLFSASEYLALKLLNDESCNLNAEVAKQMEGYRKMKNGNIAPNIKFSDFTYFPEGINAKDLDHLSSDFTLIIFAAGWCSHCVEEIPKIAPLYDKWKANNIEVVMVSLDESAGNFAKFAGSFPFISTTDYKKWDGQTVQDYYVFATPTMFLLNRKREILLRIKSVAQMDAWFDRKFNPSK